MLAPLGLRQVGQKEGQFHVSLRREHRQEIVQLEYNPYVPGPPFRQPPIRQPVDPFAADADGTLARAVEAADEIQERGLPRAGRAHQGQELPGAHAQVKVPEHVDVLRSAMEDLFDTVDDD